MTSFTDGPAAGQTLMIKRAPIFLRVTRKRFALETHPQPHQQADQFDALDQPEDKPADDEELFCYRNTEKKGGGAFIDYGGNKKHMSGFYPMSEYALYPDQPPDAVMRNNARWRLWCGEQALAHNIKHAES